MQKADEFKFNLVQKLDAGMILQMTQKEGIIYDNYIGAFAHNIKKVSILLVMSLTYGVVNDNFPGLLNTFVDPAAMLVK